MSSAVVRHCFLSWVQRRLLQNFLRIFKHQIRRNEMHVNIYPTNLLLRRFSGIRISSPNPTSSFKRLVYYTAVFSFVTQRLHQKRLCSSIKKPVWGGNITLRTKKYFRCCRKYVCVHTEIMLM